MCWLDTGRTPVYHVTSNHNTFDEQSERVWRDVFPDIPRNGPAGQEGLSYWVQRRDLLMVFVNTSFTGLGRHGHVECEWLEGVLAEHAHLRHKIVIGHHPVFPVNGYNEQPTVVRDRRGGRAALVGASAMRRVGLPLLAHHRIRCTEA